MDKVLVLMGGPSTEHEVSLRSGAAVVRHMPAASFDPVPVVIGMDGAWRFPPARDLSSPVPALDLSAAIAHMKACSPVCAFIAMHGAWGEDGRIQSLCDLMGIPHIGADAVASAVAIDKWFAKAVYRAEGVPTPEAVLIRKRGPGSLDDLEHLARPIGLPCVVKTPRMGSSKGVFIARDLGELRAKVEEALALDERVILEAFKKGRELTVPVLEDLESGEVQALPVIEIVVRRKASAFFDYEAKYDPVATEEICPAPIPADVAKEVQGLAIRAHLGLMLSGFSRTDFIWDGEGLWALETNTIPGLTEASLFPKAVAVAGGTFSSLIRTLVLASLRRASRSLPVR